MFLRDWTNSATVMTHHVARSSDVHMPRMIASIPRVLDGTESNEDLADALSPGELLLAPETLPLDLPVWSRHSHDSFFMSLDPRESNGTLHHSLQYAFVDSGSFFDTWRAIPDVGSIVDPAVIESVDAPMGQYLVVASLGGQRVGTVRITTGSTLAGMSLLAVVPAVRRSGVARTLIEFGLDLASKDGCRSVHFQVDGHNDTAIRLYDQLGATTIARYRYLQRS